MQIILERNQSLAAPCWVFLRCSVLSFLSHASSTQDEKLELGFSNFSRSTLTSISSINSCGKRIFFFADLLLVLPLDTYTPQNSHTHVRTRYNKKRENVRVDMCAHKQTYCAHSIDSRYYNERRPEVLATTIEASYQNVIEIYAMTVKNSTTHSPAIYYWLFLAVSRSDTSDRPHRKAVTASSEHEARKLLAQQFILFFAGRLPVNGGRHA